MYEYIQANIAWIPWKVALSKTSKLILGGKATFQAIPITSVLE